MNRHNRLMRELENIEIPKELHKRSMLGVRQAKRELGLVRTRPLKAVKVAGITAAGLVLAITLGMAASPTFAAYVKSWFSLGKTDDGLKKAADEGFAVPINKQATDQGITFKVKEAIHDVFRISILYGVEQDGNPLNSDRLFDTFIPNGTDDDPYVNRYDIVDDEGNVLPLNLRQIHAENDRILTLSLDDLFPGRGISSLSEIPDRITVRFDINQIGRTRGKWHLEVPIDLTRAKASTTIVPINKRFVSPEGFSIDFHQLYHGPSKSELVLQVDETQAWRSAKKSEPMFRYEVKDGQGTVVAAFDGLRRGDLMLGGTNNLEAFFHGQGTMGHVRYWHPFLPFGTAKDLKLELTAIYSQEKAPSGSSITLQPATLAKEPLRKEVNGKSVAFKVREKTDETQEKLKDGSSVFQGKGWILEADQQLGSDTIDLQWRFKDGQEKEMHAVSATELEQDAQGNYRNRTLFFFAGQTEMPESLALSLEGWIKKTPVSWSIPLVPSEEPLPPVYDEPVYEMTVEELKPEIVRRAEQAMRKLAPDKPAELYGVMDYSDRWFLYAKDNSGSSVIMMKETAEPVAVQRVIPYGEADRELRDTVEETLRQMNPEQPIVFKEALREQSKANDRWLFQNQQAQISVDAVTGKVDEAAVNYPPGHLDPKAKAAAEQAYQVLSQGKSLRVTHMSQKMTPTEHVWELGRDMSVFAKVGVRTNRVWSVELGYKNDDPGDELEARKKYAKPHYMQEQAIAKVSSTVKQVFGTDLEGADVSVKLNEYTFKKKGSMTIKGTVNAKGEFWRLERIPEEGIRD